MPSNEINLFDILALIGFMGFYITLKIMVYSKEYETKDRVIKRGHEWDYDHKGNEYKNKKENQ